MRQAPGALLRHTLRHTLRAHAIHYDLVIGYGLRCPTVRIINHGTRFTWEWSAPHRRHYLDFSGPVSDSRGVVCKIWYGQVRWTLSEIHFGGWYLGAHGRIPVVPLHFCGTLPRT